MNLARTVETFAMLGEESRMRLCALLHGRAMNVSELVLVTGLTQSRVSTHLAKLRDAGIVRDRKQGQSTVYSLAFDDLPKGAQELVTEAIASDDPTLARDADRVDALYEGELPAEYVGKMEHRYSPGRTWPALARGLAALMTPGDVLDVGSGDGAVAAMLRPYSRTVTCLDTSARMVEAAKERIASLIVRQGNAEEMPFREACFDTVLAFHILTYCERPERVVSECARVLRPRGRLVVLTLEAHTHKDITSRYGERRPGLSADALRDMMHDAGFRDASVHHAHREAKSPHFVVLTAVGTKPGNRP
ncbi:MAG: metalloregulator ArsR/SmtB family transcription factor [Polyangiaceae bacterium]